MTTKLWAKLASGALAAVFAIGAASTAEALEYAPPPVSTMEQSTEAESAIPSPSTRVSGTLADRQGHPLTHVELHFQGRINSDIYTIHTRTGGSFSIALPPGVYDLRGEHGAIIVSGVKVGQHPVNLGQVQTPAPLAPTRLFDRQEIGEAIVHSPAPAGARVLAPGGPVAPIAVLPAPHPRVQGTPSGKAMAPASVIPMGVEKQIQLPPGAKPIIGGPPITGETAAPSTGLQPKQAIPSTE
jgi:hypothetical protein